MKVLNKTWAAYAILAVIIVLFYGNTLSNGFVHDDIWEIVENQDIRSFANLPKIFGGCAAEQLLGTCHRASTYRPLQFVSYLFTYQISKDAWAFHLVNLLYTFGLATLVYKFFKILFEKNISLRGSSRPVIARSVATKQSPKRVGIASLISFARNDSLALLATLFFLAHPINSEVINWAGGVPELLVSIFTLAMLLLYIKFTSSGKIIFLIFSSLLYFLGLLSKETGFFAIGLIALYEILFVGIKTKRSFLRKYFKTFTFYLVPTFLYLLIRANVLGRIVYKDEGFYSLSFWGQITNAIALYPRYALKLFYPFPLSLQHPFIPITGIDGGVIFAVLFLLVNISLLYIAIRKRQKVLVFGFFFFAIMLSPVLIFINKLGEFVFSERYLFLPSIGFTLIVFEVVRLQGHALVRTRPRLIKSAGLAVFVIFLLASWYIVAVNRNKDWKDNLSSYLSIVRVYPDNKKAYGQANTILFRLSSKRFVRKDLSFLYPKGWGLTESKSCHSDISNRHPGPSPVILGILSGVEGDSRISNHCIVLTSSDETFKIQIELDEKPSIETVDEYLSKQTSSLGTLINQGPALIPNVDKAYVKIWQDKDVGKMQFFLFKKDVVVEIRVWPSDSAYMRDFDEILRSVAI